MLLKTCLRMLLVLTIFAAVPCWGQTGDMEEALALTKKATQLFQAGRYQEALPLYQRDLQITEKARGPEHPDTATSLNNLALLYEYMGAYDQAVPLYQRALKIKERAMGPENSSTATILNNLALLYMSMGAYDQALPLCQRALKIREKALGPEHPDTAAGLNNLAALYRSMGAYDQALPLLKRALKIKEKALGPEHSSTAAGLNNLVELYRSMGAYDQALPLSQRVLKIWEETRGPEHPDTAVGLNNLAELYRSMGAYDQALPLCQRALKIREKALGPEHPYTAVSLNNLALLYQVMGAYDQALPLLQRALKIAEKARGPEHPETATSLINLALLYQVMAAYDQALPLLQRALKIKEKALGPEHPDTSFSLINLALLYKSTGAYDQALPLSQRALKIAEKALGPEHPDTATSLNNLAELYRYMGAYDQALPLYQRALKIREKALGPERRDTGTSLNNLAMLYLAMGAYDQALPLFQQALMIAEKTLGRDHPETAVNLTNLAELYSFIGTYDQALPLYQRALQIKEKSLGPEHPDTALSLTKLAVLYKSMGAYDQALPLCQQALKIKEKALGPDHPDTAVSLNDLAALYSSMGADDQALPLCQRALKIKEKSLGPEHPSTGTSLSYLAVLYKSMGAYDQALPLYQRALKITKKSLGPEHPYTATNLSNLGGLYLARKDFAQAEFYFKRGKSQVGLVNLRLALGRPAEALALLHSLAPSWKDPLPYQTQYYTQMGLALGGVGRRGEAAQALVQAVSGIEVMRRRVTGERGGFFRAGFFGRYLHPYRSLVAVLAESAAKGESLPNSLQKYGPDPQAAAFYFAEATKGRVLLESMAAGARRNLSLQLPTDLGKKEQQLLDRLGALEAAWEKHYQQGEEALAKFKKQREDLQTQLGELVAQLRQKHPRYAALHYPQPFKPQELPLKPDEVLLEYALGDKAAYLFRVEPGRATKIFTLASGQEQVEKQIKEFMAPLISGNPKGFSPTPGQSLYALLLEPALKDLPPEKKIIIVPDGILGLLPFEALIIKAGEKLQDRLYVGDKWQITYSQSAAILALNRVLAASQAEKALFALGNPIYSADDPRYAAYKQGKEPPTVLAQGDTRGAFRALATHRDWGKTTRDSREGKELVYDPLPRTEDEVKAIAGLYGVKPEPPDILLNLKASKTNLRKSPLKDYRCLHFATHGDLTSKVQGVKEPFLVLGQVENELGQDGFLRFSDVINWQLKADLVVLSACLTGRGDVMEGEGVANFARAFQQAGARSVVVSLWKVADKQAVEYMTTFYGHLKAGKSRAEALRLARQDIKGKYPNPYYWAVFILHGEG